MIGSGATGGTAAWGRGCAWAPSHEGGGSGLAPEAERLTEQDFRAWSVEEGLANLRGEFAEVKPETPTAFPGPIAEAMFWDDSSIVGIQGPVGSGKTTTVLHSRLRRARMMPRSTIDGTRHYKLLVIRATYRQLWSTTIPDFLGVFPKDLGEWSGGRGGPVTFVMQFEDEDGPIDFTAEFMAFGDDIVGSMRGYQATDIWLHEMDTNPSDVLINGITRINRFPAKRHFDGYPAELRDYGQIVGDMNAMDKDNFAFKLFHDEKERNRIAAELNRSLPEGTKQIRIAFHRQPGYGEPGCENLHNLSAAYYPTQIATMKLLGRGDMIDRMVYNRVTYLRVGDPVFRREFNRDIHVSRQPLELVEGVPLRIGLDQGFKGAAVISQFVPPFQWRIYGVVFFPEERLFAREFGRRLREYLEERFPSWPIEGGWGDMAGEHGASQSADENATWNLVVSQTAGFPILPQRVGTNRIQPRLEAVRAALEHIRSGRPGLVIDCHDDCDPLIAAFEARYVWTDEIDHSGEKRKVPDKRIPEANVMDALQYLCLSEVLGDGLTDTRLHDIPGTGRSDAIGHNGGPPLGDEGGLFTTYDVLNPYGG